LLDDLLDTDLEAIEAELKQLLPASHRPSHGKAQTYHCRRSFHAP
jgi:hypothetical protein